MCANVDLCGSLSGDALHCPYVRCCPEKTTGTPLSRNFLKRHQARWSTPPRPEKSPRPLLSLTKFSQPKSLPSRVSLVMYSPISLRILFSWVQERVDWDLLLQGAVISYPRAPSRRGSFWNIVGVGWGGTGSKRFSLLPSRQLMSPPSPEGSATAAASVLRGEPWGGAATPRSLGESSPPLACVCPILGSGQRRHLPPPPPPSSPRMTFMSHAMSACSPPGEYAK